jgi:tetratricopeptide (TPR) repeat protein
LYCALSSGAGPVGRDVDGRGFATKAEALLATLEDDDERDTIRDYLSWAHARAGRFDAARATIEQISDPSFKASGLTWLMAAHGQAGDGDAYTAALSEARKAAAASWMAMLADSPIDAEYAFVELAWACAYVGDFASAADVIDKHITRSWMRAVALARVAQESCEAGRIDDAKKLCDAAMQSVHVATVALGLADPGPAETIARAPEADELEGDDAQWLIDDARVNLVGPLTMVGRADEAAAMAKELAEREYGAHAHSAIAFAMSHIGKPDAAAAQLRRAWDAAMANEDEDARGYDLWTVGYWAGYAGLADALNVQFDKLDSPLHRARYAAGIVEGLAERRAPKHSLMNRAR